METEEGKNIDINGVNIMDIKDLNRNKKNNDESEGFERNI